MNSKTSLLKSSPPKRTMVKEAIEGKIHSGELAIGERLATVRDLGTAFNVSISVVQNALRELCRDGFIECRGASGYFVIAQENAAPPFSSDSSRGQAFLLLGHHSDLLWRHDLAIYRAIRDEQLVTLFGFARRHRTCAFALEQAHIAEVFFTDHPELLDEARRLAQEKRLDLCGAYSIPDLNLISGESILRNLEIGREVYRELFDAEPDYVQMTDAFGMCAQLPQILLHCGQKTLMPGRLPNTPAGIRGASFFRWHSLAGSESVLVFQPAAYISHLGFTVNVPMLQERDSRLAHDLHAVQELSGPALIIYGTEETALRESIFPLVAQANRNGRKPLVFSSGKAFLERFSHDRPDFPDYTGECNPIFTGCYTTRIGIKQRIRLAENRLMLAEALDVLRGACTDRTAQWKALFLAQFHDGACGCHSDASYADVDRALRDATPEPPALAPDAQGFAVLSYSGVGGLQPVAAPQAPAGLEAQLDLDGTVRFLAELPQCGVRRFAIASEPPAAGVDAPPVFENEWLKADFTGVFPVITAKGLPVNPFGQDGFGELRFRHDTGSMWSEEFWSQPRGREFTAERLTRSVSGPVFHLFVTEGEILPGPAEDGNTGPHWPGFGRLSFRKEYRFYHRLDHFTLRLALQWQGTSTKVSIRFPVGLKPDIASATFETPFASATRKPYFEVREEFANLFQPLAENGEYAFAHGDWPALNWVRLADFTCALTVANTGTPGHQVANGAIEASLLRSPVKTADGGITPPVGAHDEGAHAYDFAFRAHSLLEEGASGRLGLLLNRPPAVLPDEFPERTLLAWNAQNVALDALRMLPDGQLQVRFHETDGVPAEFDLSGELIQAAPVATDAFGRYLPPDASPAPARLAPLEIRTLRLTTATEPCR